jgi:hypothetical protein
LVSKPRDRTAIGFDHDDGPGPRSEAIARLGADRLDHDHLDPVALRERVDRVERGTEQVPTIDGSDDDGKLGRGCRKDDDELGRCNSDKSSRRDDGIFCVTEGVYDLEVKKSHCIVQKFCFTITRI